MGGWIVIFVSTFGPLIAKTELPTAQNGIFNSSNLHVGQLTDQIRQRQIHKI
jgi:hypothetical protein